MDKCNCPLCDESFKYLRDWIDGNEWLKRFKDKTSGQAMTELQREEIRQKVREGEQRLTDELRKAGEE